MPSYEKGGGFVTSGAIWTCAYHESRPRNSYSTSQGDSSTAMVRVSQIRLQLRPIIVSQWNMDGLTVVDHNLDNGVDVLPQHVDIRITSVEI